MKPAYIAIALVVVLAAAAASLRVLHPTQAASGRKVLYYQDPMHPEYKSAKPGTAPDCGMDLVAVYADEATPKGHVDAAVMIDGQRQRQFGIQTVAVREESGDAKLRLFARVQADESRVFKVEFGTDGYVRETHSDSTGTHVKKNQILATVYSPDFLTVAGAYLAANERTPGSVSAMKELSANVAPAAATVGARADRLRNLGMSDIQIDEITRSHKIPEDVYVVSPVDGFILARTITAGSRFERRDQLYTIADLSVVWIEAEAFGRDADALRTGQHATVLVPGSARATDAVVDSILPEVDATTHATKVRLRVQNNGLLLRPGMFVTAEISSVKPRGLTIPIDAVIDSGSTQRVFVRTDDSHFAPRLIRTGTQTGDRIQVLSGLQPGDAVVRSGTFLVDSEARLRNP